MRASSAPFFSIIIPAYNSARTIAETIESALAQRSDDYEIIVVNDGSTDATESVAAAYGDRVQIISQTNRGLSGARNAGAVRARGQWLALLDADDTWTDDKLSAIGEAIDTNPGVVMFFSDATCFDSDSQRTRSFMPENVARAPSWEEMMAGRFQILPSSAVIRADAYLAAGGFSEEFKGACGFEDVYFWLRLREIGPFAYVSRALVNYRVTPLADRLKRYRPGFEVFRRLVRERYGLSGEQIIRARRKARVSLWGRAARSALARGDKKTARSALFNALREDPLRSKYLWKLLRTYLPFSYGSGEL
jgi:glycosyltransferase involved in cell wall biosynthesis